MRCLSSISRAASCWPTSRASNSSGMLHQELVGQKIEVLVPPRFRAKHPGHRSGYFSGDPHVRPMGAGLTLMACARMAAEFPVEISLSPVQTPAGPMVISAVRDVTARKGAEDKFRALLESAPDAMVIVDQQGKIVLVNSRTEELFGYTQAGNAGIFGRNPDSGAFSLPASPSSDVVFCRSAPAADGTRSGTVRTAERWDRNFHSKSV